MKNLLISFFAFTFFLTACNSSPDPFLITKNSVGKLNDSTKVKDLKRVFETDSLSQFIDGDEFTGNTNIIIAVVIPDSTLVSVACRFLLEDNFPKVVIFSSLLPSAPIYIPSMLSDRRSFPQKLASAFPSMLAPLSLPHA